MKKIIGNGTGTTQRRVAGTMGARIAAIVGCLAVALGWSGAAAQDFTENHLGAGANLSNWNQSGGTWTISDADGVKAPINNNNISFITHKNNITADGTFIVKMSTGNNDWQYQLAGIVFRYSPTGYYAIHIDAPWFQSGVGYGKVNFVKNNFVQNPTGAGVTLLNSANTNITTGDTLTVKVEINGSTFKVYCNDKLLGEVVDDDYASGSVGYVKAKDNTSTRKFYSSSWASAEVVAQTVPSAYPGYYIWNTDTKKTFTGGSGAWSGNFWSKDSSTVVHSWATGSNALFYATPSGTVTSAGQSVGNMAFVANGYTIDGTSLALGATARSITVAASSATINSALSGSGGLTKDGAGTLTLGGTAANTYTGGTVISAGTVIANKSGALGTDTVTLNTATLQLAGSGTVAYANPFKINGGTLINNTANTTLSGSVSLSGATAIPISAGQNLGFTGAVSGSTTINKGGAGTLQFTGNSNAYTGIINVNEGKLQVGSGTTGIIGGNIVVAAGTDVTFSRSDNVTYGGNIAGAGSLIKMGTGTITLGGNNAYTGGTTISAGGITVAGQSNIGGPITMGAATATLTVNPTTAGSFGRTVFGSGAAGTGIFVKSGTAALNLTAPVNVAKVNVSAGTLNVNTGAELKADSIVVAAGATLGGNVAIGDMLGDNKIVVSGTASATGGYWGSVILNATGKLAHDGVADLQIGGNLSMNGAATLELPLTGLSSTSCKISVNNALTVSNTAKLNIIGTGAITTGTYRIISAAGNVTGDFGDRITIDGQPNTDYKFSTKLNGKNIELIIEEKGGGIGDAKNYLTVDSVVYAAGGSNITLKLSGLNDMRKYVGAVNGARVMSVYVWYKTSPATTAAEAGANDKSKGIEIPLASIPATGNTMDFPFPVPAGATADELYFFNVATYWSLDGTDIISPPSISNAKSAYLRDPKASVKANELTIRVDSVTSNTETGVSFRLTVGGQNEPSLTPGVAYKPSVDSVAIWYKRNGDAPTLAAGNSPLTTARVPGSSNVWVVSLESLRDNGTLNLSVGPMVNPVRDTAYFAIAPRWKGAGVDSLARPLYVASRNVIKAGTEMPPNPVLLNINQPDRRAPSVSVTVGADGSFSGPTTDISVKASFNSLMTDLIDEKTLTKEQVSNGYTYVITNDGFVGAERTVYFFVTVTDLYGVMSEEKQFQPTVGRKPPTPVTGFTAEPGAGGSMYLSWQAPTAAANDISDPSGALVRVYYSENPIAADADITELNLVTEIPATVTTAVAQDLALNTRYYFAAVLFDIVNASKPDWNLKSLAATCDENTGSGNVIDNVLTIEKAEFDPDATVFNITVKLEENWPTGDYRYAYLVTVGDNQTVLDFKSSGPPNRTTANQTFQITTEPLLGEALRFNTVYTLYVYVVDGQDNASRKGSPTEVEVGPFSKQTVAIPVGGSGVVDNGNFKLGTTDWLDVTPIITTTVSVSANGSQNDDGFIYINDYGYSYTVSVPEPNSILPLLGSFKVSIRANEIPAPYTEDDVRIYRWNAGNNYWEVVFNTIFDGEYFNGTGAAIDSVYRENGSSTYRLMINTRKPKVDIPTTDILDMGGQITATSTVESNVGNFRVTMVGGPAKGTAELNPIALIGPESGTMRSLTFEIGKGIVEQSQNFGVLAFIIVNDGSEETITNLSYRVKSSTYGGFPAMGLRDKEKWSPFAAQVELDDQSVRTALEPALFKAGDLFAPYDTLYRLFRYGKNGWIEYDTTNDSLFAMKPAQLMWFKTSAKQVTFEFGRAKSISLRDTFNITLPPNQWTDLVLPFRFNVRLGDVLDATTGARENLEFYRWKGGDPRFTADLLNKPGNVADTSQLRGENEPFTVFNKSNASVTLRIPPIPASLSPRKATSNGKALAKTTAGAQRTASDAWHYTLRATADDMELSDVYVGYYATEITFAVPPSFGNEAVVLVGDNGAEIGHHFGPSIANGRTYRLRFYNDDKRQKAFNFSAVPSANTPVGARVTFVRASTGEILGNGSNSAQSISVAGLSREDVFMIVGGNGYRAKAASVNAGAKFSVSKILVNRAARSARVNFYVPESGINQVEVSIYDIKGRQVWRVSQKTKAASWNTVEWNGRASRKSASTGLYIVRVKAMGANGRPVGVDTKRIVFSR